MLRIRMKSVKIQLLDNVAKSSRALDILMHQPVIGFDCEGTRLGRFGKLALMQFRTVDSVFICDAMKEGLVKIFQPVLESEKIVKVMHDCREDTSALFHQAQIEVKTVFDTQIAYRLREKILFMPSLHFINDSAGNNELSMNEDTWLVRPLGREAVQYAIKDVLPSLALYKSMETIGSTNEYNKEIEKYLNYKYMNTRIRSKKDIKTGVKVQAMLAAKAVNGWYFKLNCGLPGIVSGLEPQARIHYLKLGEVVNCVVSGKTELDDAVLLEPL